MSIRRAVEAHIKLVLDPYVPSVPNGWSHQVVESLRIEDRPMPSVVVVAGSAAPAFSNLVDSLGNYNIPITVIVMSSIDDTTVDKHSELAHQVTRILQNSTNRRMSKVRGLVFYDIIAGSVGQENQGRRMVTVLNFEAIVNYVPEQPIP